MKSTTFGQKTFSYDFPTPVFGPKKLTCHIPWDRRLGDYGEVPVATPVMRQIATEFMKSLEGFYDRSWKLLGTQPGRGRTGNAIIIVRAVETKSLNSK